MLLLLLPHTYYSSYLVGGFEDLYWQNNDSKSIVHVVLHLYTNNGESWRVLPSDQLLRSRQLNQLNLFLTLMS
jgi:hypothetical protein